jgi:hypothetical protein
MPITYSEIGTGITKRPVTTITNPLTAEDCEELRRRQPASSCKLDFDYDIAWVEAKAQQILRAKSVPLPVSKQIQVLPDGSWCEVDADVLEKAPSPGDYYTWSMNFAIDRYGIDSPQGYAARLLFFIEQVRRAQARQDMERGFTAALMIGALYTEAHMKELWEDAALSGEKSRQGARTSGKKRKGTTKSGQPQIDRDAEVLKAANNLRQQERTSRSDWCLAQCLAQSKCNRETWNSLSARQIYRILGH